MEGARCTVWIVPSLLMLVAFSIPSSQAQVPDRLVEQRAQVAFHGPDRQGKDGPLAPVGLDLARLYVAWTLHEEQGRQTTFTAPEGLPVRDGRVTIDATAARDAPALRDSLEALGLTGSAQTGAVVSGRLPIGALAEAARLANLRAMRPARAMTHRRPAAPPVSPTPDTARATPARVDTAAPATSVDNAPSLYWIGGVVVLIVGLLFFLLRPR